MLFRFEGLQGVNSVVASTYYSLRDHAPALMSEIAWLLAFYVSMDFVFAWFVQRMKLQALLLPDLIAFFISSVVWVLIAVRTHRVLLSGLSNTERRLSNAQSYLRFAMRVLWLFVTSCFTFVPVFYLIFNEPSLNNVSAVIAGLVFVMCCLWFLARFFISLPSIAVGRFMGFSEAWARTHGHQFLMFFVAILVPLVISSFLYGVIFGFLGGWGAELVSAVAALFITVVEIALLSRAYSYIMGDGELFSNQD